MKEGGIPSYVYIIATLLIGVVFIGVLVVSQRGELNSREEELAELAVNIGADREQFVQDYQSSELRDAVQASDAEANDRGVAATPTVFVAGERVQTSEAEIRDAISAALEESDGPVLVEEFFDFQCPACGSFHTTALSIKNDFGDDIDFQVKPYFLPTFNREISEVYAYAWYAADLQGLGDEMEAEIYRYHLGDSRYNYDLAQSLLAGDDTMDVMEEGGGVEESLN